MLNRVSIVRASACSLIAVFHTLVFLNANGVALPTLLNFATPGFHLFLLFSGVVLVHTTRPDETPLPFLFSRFARLAPLYWLFTVLAIALAFWKPWILPFADLAVESIARSLLFVPHADASGQIRPILFVAWTLNYLVLFYLLFAASLLAPRTLRTWIVAVGLLLVMALAPLLSDPSARRFYSSPLLLEFATGVLIGEALTRGAAKSWLTPRSMTVCLVLGLVGMFFIAWSGIDGLPSVLANCLMGSMVVVGTVGHDLYGKPIDSPLLRGAGEISYPVLLIHPLIIPMLGGPLIWRLGDAPVVAALLIPGVLAASFVGAWFSYRFIQRPIIGWARSATRRMRHTSPVQASP